MNAMSVASSPDWLTEQEVVETVVVLGDEDHRLVPMLARSQRRQLIEKRSATSLDGGLVGSADRCEARDMSNLMRWKNWPSDRVGVLVRVEDVRPMAVQHLRERGDEAFPVGATRREG